MKQIVIDITDEGEVKVETRGFTGKACLAESKILKDILGTEVARSLTPAFYTTGKTVIKKHLNLCG